MALLVILFGLLLYIPFAGSYGLWDPWETHYSEVARQMTHRGDYISLWWPGSPRDADVFWSKPVLSFWMMSLAMHVAGIGLPGHPAGEMALGHRAEWAARVPFCLTGVLGIYAVYLVTSRFVSRRAGVLAAVVVATAPMYSLVARQAMTDMAFVGPMAMALALAALALFDESDEQLPRRGRGWRSWPAQRALLRHGGAVRADGAPAADRQLDPAEGRDPLGRADVRPLRGGGDDSVLPGVRRLSISRRAHPHPGAALSLHGGDPLRAGGAGQGAGRAGAAAHHSARLPGLHRELASVAAPADGVRALRRGDRLRGGGRPLAPRHADPPRHAVLGRAVRRQPLAPDGHRPPRRSRHVRVLPARARLRHVALGRAGARGARVGGAAPTRDVDGHAPRVRSSPPSHASSR